MSLLNSTNPIATRAINVIAQLVLVIADVAIIIFLHTAQPFIYLGWAFAIITLAGIILLFYKSRWAIFLLLVPLVFLSVYLIVALYNDYS